jgi:hypothetical protein
LSAGDFGAFPTSSSVSGEGEAILELHSAQELIDGLASRRRAELDKVSALIFARVISSRGRQTSI